MDSSHFDALTKILTEVGTRRGLLGLLSTLPVLGGLFALLVADEETDAQGRRRRRKKRHKHGKGRRRKHHNVQICQPNSKSATCAGGKCGPVENNCKQTVDCGSCTCDPLCEACFTCQDQGPNTSGTCVLDPTQVGHPCGEVGKICQADGQCICIPVNRCDSTVCGTILNNCGQPITCDPCPVINSFTATPETIDRSADEKSTLSWSISNASSCSLDDGRGGVTGVTCGDGEMRFGPAATTTYHLIASGGGAQVSAQVTVTVKYCHSITSPGSTCPTGNTAFCLGELIDGHNADHALAACDACYGAEQCITAPSCGGGAARLPQNAEKAFGYGDFSPGGILNYPSCGETGARWAP